MILFRGRVRLPLLILMAVLVLAVGIRASDIRKTQTMMTDYFDMILFGNYEPARALWLDGCTRKAGRLGIEYESIPIKADMNSPVIYDFERLRPFLPDALYENAVVDSGLIRWRFGAYLESEEITHDYYLYLDNGYFWFVPPYYKATMDWPVTESRYFRFHIKPGLDSLTNELAVKSLDSLVDRLAERIAIPSERLDLLAREKLDYYLCADADEVSRLTGRKERGIYDPAFDAVITSFMPHFHEVALFLVNFKLQKLPPATVPSLRGGLAAWLGGRWQRAPEVVLDFGEYILKYDVIALDSVLDPGGLTDPVNAEIAFPISAWLAEYLATSLGLDKFFELYRELSGDFRTVAALPGGEIKEMIIAATGTSWENFLADFHEHVDACGGECGLIYPGRVRTDRPLVDSGGLKIAASKKWLQVEYDVRDSVNREITVLFGPADDMHGKRSILFSDQFGDRIPYESWRYGLKLDKNEIGLYDYATNRIIAKYVDDFAGKSDYFDNGENRVRAHFERSLIDGSLPDNEAIKIIPDR